MRPSLALLSTLLLLPVSARALSKVEVDDLAHHPLVADFPSGGELALHLRSGEIHIVGTDANKVSVHVGGRRGEDSTDMRARFESSGNPGSLRVAGGPNNEVTITVEIPRRASLHLRVFAGEVNVTDIVGDKDIELSAGDLKVDVGNPADYAHVAASVTTGDLNASPFGEQRDGLFRSFEKSGNGKYRLAAHVGAGDLILR